MVRSRPALTAAFGVTFVLAGVCLSAGVAVHRGGGPCQIRVRVQWFTGSLGDTDNIETTVDERVPPTVVMRRQVPVPLLAHVALRCRAAGHSTLLAVTAEVAGGSGRIGRRSISGRAEVGRPLVISLPPVPGDSSAAAQRIVVTPLAIGPGA